MKSHKLANSVNDVEHGQQANVASGNTESSSQSPTLVTTAQDCIPPSAPGVDWFRAVAKQAWQADVTKVPKKPPTIAGFEDFQEVARGGMAVVYKGRQSGVNRTVALKMLVGGEHSSPTARARLRIEAESIGLLQHPNVIQIYQVGEIDGQPYLVLEYAPKGSLAERVSSETWTPKTVAELVETLARAIHAAHLLGVVHRDLKPANVVYSKDAVPKIVDFGLAKIIKPEGEQEELTEDEDLLGTVQFMAPEQATPSKPVGPAADIYALGGILYTLLVGRPPFKGATRLETLHHVCHKEPTPLRKLNRCVPRDLETICLKALEKQPNDRFDTAEDMADDLRRWRNKEPIRARRPSFVDRVARWGQRHPAATTVGAAVAVLALAIAIWANRALAQVKVAQANEAAAQERAKASQIQAVLEARSKEEVQAHSLLSIANQRLETPTYWRVKETLDQILLIKDLCGRLQGAPSAPEIDVKLRSLLIRALGEYDIRLAYQVTGLPRSEWQTWPVAIHPSGHAMVLGAAERPYLVLAGERFRAPEGLTVPNVKPIVRFSPTGSCVVFAPASGGVSLWNDAVSERMATWSPDKAPIVLDVGFDASEKTLSVVGADGSVRRLSLPGLETDPARDYQFKQLKGPPAACAFDRNANQVAAGDAEGNVVVHRNDGQQMQRFNLAGEAIVALGWSTDSNLLGIATRTGAVYVYDLRPQLVRHRLFWNEVPTEHIVFSPDGRWICAGQRGGAKVWDLVSGEQVLTFPTSVVGFSKDGRRFAGGSYDGVDLYDLTSPTVLLPCIGHRSQVIQTTWSANSVRFASLDSALELIVWDSGTGRQVCQAQLPAGHFLAGNRGLAMSAVGDAVCFAYAADKQGFVQFLDVTSGKMSEPFKVAQHWFFRAAYRESTGTFLIVGEGPRPQGQGERETVLYEAAPNQPPKRRRILRTSPAGELGGFDHFLTPDARHYIWSGPGQPSSAHRTELWNVDNEQLIQSFQTRPTKPGNGGPAAYLSPSGKQLWTSWVQGLRYYPLSGIKPALAQRTDALPAAVSADDTWVLYCQTNDAPVYPSADLLLYDLSQPEVAVNFTIGRELRGPHRQSVTFSPDSRKAVWGSIAGRITIMDVSKLKAALADFADK